MKSGDLVGIIDQDGSLADIAIFFENWDDLPTLGKIQTAATLYSRCYTQGKQKMRFIGIKGHEYIIIIAKNVIMLHAYDDAV